MEINGRQTNLYLRVFLSFLIFSFLNARTVNGQRIAEIPTSKTVYLTDVLNILKQEKQVAFLFEPATVNGVKVKGPINYQDDIKTTLKQILPPASLKFKKVGRFNYVIKKTKSYYKKQKNPINQKPKRFELSQKTAVPKSRTISGRIISEEDNLELIGATVRIKGTNIGTTTDEYGNYKLDIPISTQTISFSYLGFEEKELHITDQRKLDVALKVASTDLREVIVMAVGLEANKRSLAFAADNLEMKNIIPAGESNIINAFSASTPGVWVNSSSGSPGASSSMYIRGLRSVNGSNKPLFILDGMPIDNTTTGNITGGVDVSNRLIDLNPNDIEKVTILRGQAATALYGIRAANGAVVMTSKKGNQGKPRIKFSSSFGLKQVNKLPAKQQIYTQGKFRNGNATYLGPETNTASSYGAPINELEFDGDTSYPFDKNGRLVPLGQGNGQAGKIYDAYDALFVNGQTMDNHLAISGGTNWFDYYLSFGQFRETGVVPRSSFERYSLKGVFGVQLMDKLSISMSTNLINSNGFRMKRGSQFSGVPLGLFRNPINFDIGNGKTGNEAAEFRDAYIFENGKQRAFRGNGRYDNPFWSVNRNPFKDNVNRLIQNVNFNYQIAPWLKASWNVGLDTYSDKRNNAYDINSGTHRNGQIELFDIESTNINSDFILTAEKRLNQNWTLKSSIGHNFFNSRFSLEETIGQELEKQGVFNISNAIQIGTEESILKKKVAGVFADLNLQFKNLLYFNLTGRNDWSSTLPKKNNSFFYPSLNIGFEFSELFDWAYSSFLNYGKLRFSISKVGNDAGTYLTDTYFNPVTINGDDLLPNVEFPAFGVSAFERSGLLGNPQLRPESTATLELGTDLKLLNGRLQLDFTWYKTVQKDQIINRQLSASSGFLRVPENIGAIENKGIEALIDIRVVRKKQFNWTISVNFTKFQSIVTDLPNENSSIVLASFTNLSSMIIEGQPYGVLVGTSIKKDALGRDIIDYDGFPMVNDEQTIIGNPTPDWLMGIRNTINWKNFTLSALIDIRKGGDIWNGTRGVMSYLGVSKVSGDQRNVTNHIFPGVTETGEINTKTVDFANPANGMEGIYWRRYGFLGLAEDHIEDASWVRLRTLKLGYQFVPKWLKKSAPEIDLSLTGHNLLLVTKYTGVDPETNLRGDSNIIGWDYFTMPSTKGISFNINLTF